MPRDDDGGTSSRPSPRKRGELNDPSFARRNDLRKFCDGIVAMDGGEQNPNWKDS